jgi:hypothetical protein
MAASNASYGIIGADLLPFSPVSPDVEQSFRVEICLLSAHFKIPSSAVESSRPSAAAARCPPSAGHAAADASGVSVNAAAVCSPASQGAPTKTKNKKAADTSAYAWPQLSRKSTVFKSQVPGKAPEAEISVSPDAAVRDEVKWEEGTCVAVFENLKLKEAERALGSADARKWQQHVVDISVFQAKKTKDEKQPFIKASAKELGFVTVNVADFVGADKPAQQLSSPDGKFSLTFQIKTSALQRAQPTGAPHADARAARSREDMLSSAKSQLGNAQAGRELLLKVDPDCALTQGMHIGIVVEDAWRGQGFMLLHKLSKFEACDPGADNYFGQIAKLDAEAGFKAMRVRCPVISSSKGGKAHQESRFGWRLLSACSGRLTASIDMRSAPYAALYPEEHPICCIFRSGNAAQADDAAVEQQAEELKTDASSTEAIQSEITELKRRALGSIGAAVELTQEELGAVLLRAGFLAAQPLVSECVRMLIARWYPDTHEDDCVRAFGSKDGPWDMFYVFDYLRKRERNLRSSRNSSSAFSNLLQELGYAGAADASYDDRQQRLLEDMMDRCHRSQRAVCCT